MGRRSSHLMPNLTAVPDLYRIHSMPIAPSVSRLWCPACWWRRVGSLGLCRRNLTLHCQPRRWHSSHRSPRSVSKWLLVLPVGPLNAHLLLAHHCCQPLRLLHFTSIPNWIWMGAFTSVGLGNVRPSRSRYKNAIASDASGRSQQRPRRRSSHHRSCRSWCRHRYRIWLSNSLYARSLCADWILVASLAFLSPGTLIAHLLFRLYGLVSTMPVPWRVSSSLTPSMPTLRPRLL